MKKLNQIIKEEFGITSPLTKENAKDIAGGVILMIILLIVMYVGLV